MDQHLNPPDPNHPDPNYDETVDPKNPPNSVTRPAVGRATITGFLGSVVLFSLVVAAALIYWTASNRRIDPDPGRRDEASPRAAEVGTTGAGAEGERERADETPGGFDPAPRPGSTREEIERRGGDDAAGMPRELGSILEGQPSAAIGRRVSFHDLNVASVEGGTFWIHDGDAKVQVVQPSGATSVREGQVVDVSGVVESDGRGGVRIRADRVVPR